MNSDPGLNPSPPSSPFSLATFEQQLVDVRFTPNSGRVRDTYNHDTIALMGSPRGSGAMWFDKRQTKSLSLLFEVLNSKQRARLAARAKGAV